MKYMNNWPLCGCFVLGVCLFLCLGNCVWVIVIGALLASLCVACLTNITNYIDILCIFDMSIWIVIAMFS